MNRSIVIAIALLAVACGTPQTSVPAKPDKPVASATAAARTPQTLLDIQGSGIKQSQTFTTSGEWTITWSAHASDYSTHFGIYVTNADTQAMAGVVGNVTVPAGQTMQDVSHGHRAGRWYLEINSSGGDWHVTATG